MSTKQQSFKIVSEYVRGNCIREISSADADGSVEVIIRPAKTSKTLAQLGGLFGLWISYLSDVESRSVDEIHKYLKSKFLARIYVTDPAGDIQEQWVELLAEYQESGKHEKMMAHADRISLSWVTIDQMRQYMNAIENHYISIGVPLPILDKFRRAYNA